MRPRYEAAPYQDHPWFHDWSDWMANLGRTAPHTGRKDERAVFLIPFLFHSAIGLPLTIVIAVALIALRIALRQWRRARSRPNAQHSIRETPVAASDNKDHHC